MSEESTAMFALGMLTGGFAGGWVSWRHFKEEAEIYRELSDGIRRRHEDLFREFESHRVEALACLSQLKKVIDGLRESAEAARERRSKT